MAITAEAEQACYNAFAAALAADTANANGLANVTQSAGAYTSNAVLVGNITATTPVLFRVGDPIRTPNVPRIEWEGAASNEVDTQSYARVEMIVRLHHYTNRETPRGYGSQNNVALRSRQVFHRSALSATGGWSFSTVVRKRGVQVSGDPKQQHLVVEYTLFMSAGTSGGF